MRIDGGLGSSGGIPTEPFFRRLLASWYLERYNGVTPWRQMGFDSFISELETT